MSRRPASSRGVRNDDDQSSAYATHTRNQSNGGRSLYDEHLALYQAELAAERATESVGS